MKIRSSSDEQCETDMYTLQSIYAFNIVNNHNAYSIIETRVFNT